MNIVIACGKAVEPFNPELVKTRGAGGSEIAVVEMARRLADRGHTVRVYNDHGSKEPRKYDGVEYIDSEDYPKADACDLLIVWRNAALLDEAFAPDAKKRWLWVHDVHPSRMDWGTTFLRADKVLAMSEWHRTKLIEEDGFYPEQVVVSGGGIREGDFGHKPKRNPHRAVYMSAPDRGLHPLLALWPRIREAVPDAELEVLYGFTNTKLQLKAAGDGQRLEYIEKLEQTAISSPGVTLRGRVPRADYVRALLQAGVAAYPCIYEETGCVAMMEAQAAGLRIVTTPLAALPETVGERGMYVPCDLMSKATQDAFVEAVVHQMQRPEDNDRDQLRADSAQRFSWDRVVERWEEWMKEIT